MATAEAPSWVVLDDVFDYNRAAKKWFATNQGEEWAIVDCSRKEAFGCGEMGERIVEGLTLLVRLAAGGSYSALSIRASDEIYSYIRSQIPDDVAELEYGGWQVRLLCRVETVHRNVVVFTVAFSTPSEYSFNYYLVYDSRSASLSLLPHVAEHCHASYTRCPLPVFCGDDYSLVLLAVNFEFEGGSFEFGSKRDVVCLWTPHLPSLPSTSDVGPWKVKERRFPKIPRRFHPDVMFSSNDKAFWADLARGILYCDSSALLSVDDPVSFSYINLPQGCRLKYLQTVDMGPMKAYRTMGCVGDRIIFVAIEEAKPRGETLVKMWTLDMSNKQWSMSMEFRLQELWELQEFKKAGLPNTVPEWPFLREQEGGALYFMLEARKALTMHVPKGHYICGIDTRSKISLLLSRPLSVSQIHRPLALRSDFFKHLDRDGPRKWKQIKTDGSDALVVGQ